MSFDDNILLSFSPLPAHLCVLTWVAVAESQSQAYIFNAAAVYISFTDDALPSTAHLAFAADWNNYRGEKERGVRPTQWATAAAVVASTTNSSSPSLSPMVSIIFLTTSTSRLQGIDYYL